MSLLSTLFGIKNEASDKIDILNATLYADAISGKKIQLVDVRTSGEYHSGHIKNAINIDFFHRRNFENRKANSPKFTFCFFKGQGIVKSQGYCLTFNIDSQNDFIFDFHGILNLRQINLK